MRIAHLESRLLLVAALLSAVLMLSPPSARADVGETIILRCTHGKSLSGFSQQAYRKALKELSSDTEEYSECGSLISKAQLEAAEGRHGSSGEASSAAGTPTAIAATASEQRAITGAAHDGSRPVALDGHIVSPGIVHANISSVLNTLPTPLLAILAFALATVVLLAARALGKRVLAGRPD
jgi:hypothetical protein